ncbi:MAG: hypothetical protein Q8933_00470 [Bacteroidota bacterium]|nr:hypothetical protein [Bacteroidota bacterium]MDP4190575.1 hypothetical protein [Bacteroidota bacterium]MDP4194234.1 hypothetical protein [Bacteroidota bacterium]
MRKPSGKLILLPLIALLMSFNLQAQSYKLKYNLEKGKTYRYSSELSGDFTQQIMGQELKIENSTKITSRFLVDSIDKDGNMVLVASIDSGEVISKMPTKDTSVVSLDKFVNKKVRTCLNPYGKILSKSPSDTTSEGFESLGITQNNLLQFVRLPEKEVKAGESWTITTDDTLEMMGGKVLNSVNMTYKLAGKAVFQGHNCLKLDFTGDVKNSGKAQVMGMEVYIEGNGKTSGSTYFDNEKGIVVAVDGLINNDMTMATKGEQNMIIPINQSMKMKQILIN